MISCEFKNGTILKKVNAHFGSIAAHFIARFSKQALTMYTVSACTTKSIVWRIPADRINLKYTIPDKHIEFKLSVSDFKDTLKPVKKADPVGLEISEDDDDYKLSIQIGHVTANKESSEFMQLVLNQDVQISVKSFLSEHRRIFINCKEMEREITRFEKDSIRAIVFDNALILVGMSPGKHSLRSVNFGMMDDDEMEQAQEIISKSVESCLRLGQVAPTIKTMCKIDDSPMHVNEDSGVLEFVSFPACYGQLKLQLKCQENKE